MRAAESAAFARERVLHAVCSSTCSTCLATTGACLGCVAGYSFTSGSLSCSGGRMNALMVEFVCGSVQRGLLSVVGGVDGDIMHG